MQYNAQSGAVSLAAGIDGQYYSHAGVYPRALAVQSKQTEQPISSIPIHPAHGHAMQTWNTTVGPSDSRGSSRPSSGVRTRPHSGHSHASASSSGNRTTTAAISASATPSALAIYQQQQPPIWHKPKPPAPSGSRPASGVRTRPLAAGPPTIEGIHVPHASPSNHPDHADWSAHMARKREDERNWLLRQGLLGSSKGRESSTARQSPARPDDEIIATAKGSTVSMLPKVASSKESSTYQQEEKSAIPLHEPSMQPQPPVLPLEDVAYRALLLTQQVIPPPPATYYSFTPSPLKSLPLAYAPAPSSLTNRPTSGVRSRPNSSPRTRPGSSTGPTMPGFKTSRPASGFKRVGIAVPPAPSTIPPGLKQPHSHVSYAASLQRSAAASRPSTPQSGGEPLPLQPFIPFSQRRGPLGYESQTVGKGRKRISGDLREQVKQDASSSQISFTGDELEPFTVSSLLGPQGSAIAAQTDQREVEKIMSQVHDWAEYEQRKKLWTEGVSLAAAAAALEAEEAAAMSSPESKADEDLRQQVRTQDAAERELRLLREKLASLHSHRDTALFPSFADVVPPSIDATGAIDASSSSSGSPLLPRVPRRHSGQALEVNIASFPPSLPTSQQGVMSPGQTARFLATRAELEEIERSHLQSRERELQKSQLQHDSSASSKVVFEDRLDDLQPQSAAKKSPKKATFAATAPVDSSTAAGEPEVHWTLVPQVLPSLNLTDPPSTSFQLEPVLANDIGVALKKVDDVTLVQSLWRRHQAKKLVAERRRLLKIAEAEAQQAKDEDRFFAQFIQRNTNPAGQANEDAMLRSQSSLSQHSSLTHSPQKPAAQVASEQFDQLVAEADIVGSTAGTNSPARQTKRLTSNKSSMKNLLATSGGVPAESSPATNSPGQSHRKSKKRLTAGAGGSPSQHHKEQHHQQHPALNSSQQLRADLRQALQSQAALIRDMLVSNAQKEAIISRHREIQTTARKVAHNQAFMAGLMASATGGLGLRGARVKPIVQHSASSSRDLSADASLAELNSLGLGTGLPDDYATSTGGIPGAVPQELLPPDEDLPQEMDEYERALASQDLIPTSVLVHTAQALDGLPNKPGELSSGISTHLARWMTSFGSGAGKGGEAGAHADDLVRGAAERAGEPPLEPLPITQEDLELAATEARNDALLAEAMKEVKRSGYDEELLRLQEVQKEIRSVLEKEDDITLIQSLARGILARRKVAVLRATLRATINPAVLKAREMRLAAAQVDAEQKALALEHAASPHAIVEHAKLQQVLREREAQTRADDAVHAAAAESDTGLALALRIERMKSNTPKSPSWAARQLELALGGSGSGTGPSAQAFSFPNTAVTSSAPAVTQMSTVDEDRIVDAAVPQTFVLPTLTDQEYTRLAGVVATTSLHLPANSDSLTAPSFDLSSTLAMDLCVFACGGGQASIAFLRGQSLEQISSIEACGFSVPITYDEHGLERFESMIREFDASCKHYPSLPALLSALEEELSSRIAVAEESQHDFYEAIGHQRPEEDEDDSEGVEGEPDEFPSASATDPVDDSQAKVCDHCTTRFPFFWCGVCAQKTCDTCDEELHPPSSQDLSSHERVPYADVLRASEAVPVPDGMPAIVSSLVEASDSLSGATMCHWCQQHIASHSCAECFMKLCRSCERQIHVSKPEHQRAIIADAPQESAAQPNTVASVAPLCDWCEFAPRITYCEQCFMTLCSVCDVEVHSVKARADHSRSVAATPIQQQQQGEQTQPVASPNRPSTAQVSSRPPTAPKVPSRPVTAQSGVYRPRTGSSRPRTGVSRPRTSVASRPRTGTGMRSPSPSAVPLPFTKIVCDWCEDLHEGTVWCSSCNMKLCLAHCDAEVHQMAGRHQHERQPYVALKSDPNVLAIQGGSTSFAEEAADQVSSPMDGSHLVSSLSISVAGPTTPGGSSVPATPASGLSSVVISPSGGRSGMLTRQRTHTQQVVSSPMRKDAGITRQQTVPSVSSSHALAAPSVLAGSGVQDHIFICSLSHDERAVLEARTAIFSALTTSPVNEMFPHLTGVSPSDIILSGRDLSDIVLSGGDVATAIRYLNTLADRGSRFHSFAELPNALWGIFAEETEAMDALSPRSRQRYKPDTVLRRRRSSVVGGVSGRRYSLEEQAMLLSSSSHPLSSQAAQEKQLLLDAVAAERAQKEAEELARQEAQEIAAEWAEYAEQQRAAEQHALREQQASLARTQELESQRADHQQRYIRTGEPIPPPKQLDLQSVGQKVEEVPDDGDEVLHRFGTTQQTANIGAATYASGDRASTSTDLHRQSQPRPGLSSVVVPSSSTGTSYSSSLFSPNLFSVGASPSAPSVALQRKRLSLGMSTYVLGTSAHFPDAIVQREQDQTVKLSYPILLATPHVSPSPSAIRAGTIEWNPNTDAITWIKKTYRPQDESRIVRMQAISRRRTAKRRVEQKRTERARKEKLEKIPLQDVKPQQLSLAQ